MSLELTKPQRLDDDIFGAELNSVSIGGQLPFAIKPGSVFDTASPVLPRLMVADRMMEVYAEVPAMPTKLEQLADSVRKHLDGAGFKPEEQKQYRDHLEKFLKLDGIKPEQKEATLAQLDRLLSHKGASTVDSKHFPAIAAQLLKHFVEPNDINQGKHFTCQTATMQEILFMRNPEKGAAIVVEGALTGTYTASDGVKVKVSADSLKPGKEETPTYPTGEDRSHASQIFQVLVTNDITQRRNPPAEFVQTTEGGTDEDGGERLRVNGEFKIDPRTNKPFVHPDIHVDEQADCIKRIFGGEKVSMMTDKQDSLPADKKAEREARDLAMSKTPQAHLDFIIAPTDLKNLELILDVAHRTKDFPIIVRVDCRVKEFGGDKSETPIEHWVTIQSYDPQAKTMQISNQWGKEFDKKITTAKLYDSLWRREWDY